MRNTYYRIDEVEFKNVGHVKSIETGEQLICVCYLSLHPETPYSSYWDMEIVKRLFSGQLYTTPYTYEFAQLEVSAVPNGLTGAVIVLPATYHVNDVERLNAELAKLDWCLVILTSDSERKFPADKLKHPNMKLYMQSARKSDEPDRFIPLGAPAHIYDNLPRHKISAASRLFDWIFAGQVTHDRRRQCVKQLKDMVGKRAPANEHPTILVETGGFTQGIADEEYCRYMAAAKVAPCPSGPVTPESFRLGAHC
jgi:hypothetical protein